MIEAARPECWAITDFSQSLLLDHIRTREGGSVYSAKQEVREAGALATDRITVPQ